ncbi:MAG: lipid-A-disaccharide synthase-related protein, partial [Leptolyngbyaceae cyanobacterium bins.59]|nr:lipid-A-disaccharide synthase-related protein [Leptolyngbyaceae cyanobacterium bins.59]
RSWAKQGDFVLAVGDVVPLALAWFSGKPYAFIGTAKSEYHLRDEAGLLPNLPKSDRLAARWGSVYYPWERWLMGHPRCKAVFPRDSLTVKILQQFAIPAFDLGNPMMDGLLDSKQADSPSYYDGEAEQRELARSFTLLLLPGSRIPEAYGNWQRILEAIRSTIETFQGRSLLLLGAITPGLPLDPFVQGLREEGWQPPSIHPKSLPIPDPQAQCFVRDRAMLILTQEAYRACLHQADVAIAMAGTATEQFVGLGKPAITIPGAGPQFTSHFAETQSRLLGPSVTLVRRPSQVGETLQSLLGNPDRLQLIVNNGRQRMGEGGAAHRIATCLTNLAEFPMRR